jgi:predicted transcriptional regulator
MPLIPVRPPVEPRDTLSLRLDRAVYERLQQYAEFIGSPKDYVIAQALRQLFKKDREFVAWLETRNTLKAAGHQPRSAESSALSLGATASDGVARASDSERESGPDSSSETPRARIARGH